MRSFHARLALRIIPLLAFLVLASTALAGKNYFAAPEPYVRLATLWDAPGIVQAISPDGNLLVIYDEAAGISRLVEVATGRVLIERTGELSLRMSPSGRFVTAYNPETQTTGIIETLGWQTVAEVLTGHIAFSQDETLAMATSSGEARNSFVTTVVETTTGNIVGEFDGYDSEISPDSTLLVVGDPQEVLVRVYQVSTGALVAEIPATHLVEGRDASISARFTPDGSALAVFQQHSGTTYFINTDTWDIRFEVPGYVRFSSDGSLLVAGNQVGPGTVRLVDVATGAVLNQVYGAMGLSSDGRFLFRFEDLGNDISKVQVIDLTTNEILTELTGFTAVALKANDTLLQVFDNQTRNSRIIDLSRGIPVEIEGHADLYSFERNLLLFDWRFTASSSAQLADFESGDVYATADQIWLAPNGHFAFASDGQLVDVYGPPSARLATMPAPRQGAGIATAPPGQMEIYSSPAALDPIVEDSLNDYDFSVKGQTVAGDWLYITYYHHSTEIRRIEGWIRSDNLTVVEPWDDAPILDRADPLGSLRQIAEERAS